MDSAQRAGWQPSSIVAACGGWIALTGAVVALAWLKHRDQQDDASIFVRYARNIAAGRGWVFNDGEVVNGVTSPANTWLLAAGGLLTGGNYELVQVLLFAGGMTGAAFSVWALFRPASRVGAVIAVLLLLTVPYSYWLVGMETPLLLGCAAGAVAAFAADRPRTCALLLAMLVLVRADGVLLAVTLLLAHGWRHRRTPGPALRGLAAPAAIFQLPLVAWATWSWLTFGSVLPNTLGAKIAQVESGWCGPKPVFVREAVEKYEVFCSFRGTALLAHLFLALGALGVVFAFRQRHRCWPLLAFGIAQFAAYAWIDVPGYVWYFVPMHVAQALGLAVLLGSLWRVPRVGPPAVVSVLGGWLYVHAPDPRWLTEADHPGHAHYRSHTRHGHYFECAAWLRAHAPAPSSLATCEIGILGVELPDWRIVDMWGLVTPGGSEPIARGDFNWWYRTERPEWIVLHLPLWPGPEEAVAFEPGFFDDYAEMHRAPSFALLRRR